VNGEKVPAIFPSGSRTIRGSEGRWSLHKGMRVKTLTRHVGVPPRRGVVLRVDGDTVEVRWDDGHVSVLSGATLVPDHAKASR